VGPGRGVHLLRGQQQRGCDAAKSKDRFVVIPCRMEIQGHLS
jgi:hypothetical protein